ncbi:MAG: N-acetylmuramoyl-L-alanine amidase, partial [Bacteroidales bacterium]|nr:N-acetylmuramoyl-L-alanine amidase [Bacteroidales bacterium]
MIKGLIVLIYLVFIFTSHGQEDIQANYINYYNKAYIIYPKIPKGFLEAFAWANTHNHHKTLENTAPSCTGMPFGWTMFYLVEDGENWFNENLKLVARISKINKENIKWSPEIAILAFAKTYQYLMDSLQINSTDIKDHIPILRSLTHLKIDESNPTLEFTFYCFVYEMINFLNNSFNQRVYNFPQYNFSLENIVGKNNAKVITAKKVIAGNNFVMTEDGIEFKTTKAPCPDYNVPHCNWIASPNYSSRNGTPISAIVMHTVQGSYSGCISWFQNPNSQASTHYVVRSSDGQLTQMVLEANKAWHIGSENAYTIGYEHEGYVEQPSWYTMAMYQSSADLTKDICNAYGINPHRMFYRDTLDNGTALDYGLHVLAGSSYCTKIAGHQHFPNQTHTDPGPYWTWNTYYKLVNNNPSVTTLNSLSGNFYDSGGPSGNYSNDERKIWVIQPQDASTITLTFTSFSLEANYDFLYIYDGPSVWSPLIGRYNTQSPGTITSTSGALTIEFRSDCATTAAGWAATWTATPLDNTPPTTAISTQGEWKTQDFVATFTDSDNNQVEKAFYQVLDYDGQYWGANSKRGFFGDNFDTLHPHWQIYNGSWTVSNGQLIQNDTTLANTNIYAYLNQTLSNRYLYHFVAKVTSGGTNRRFGFHFFSDNANLPN